MVQIGIRIEPINTSISDDADALQSLAMVQISIRMSNLCISAEVCRQIRVLLVWRGVGCGVWSVEGGGGLLVRRRMGKIRWNYRHSGPLVC